MSITAPSRRGLLAATAWSVPTVLVASAAPAFAASGTEPEPPSGCTVTGYYKDPGQGQKVKGYYVLVTCDGGAGVQTVQVRGDSNNWLTATKQADGSWYAEGFQSSQKYRDVLLNSVTLVPHVAFPPK